MDRKMLAGEILKIARELTGYTSRQRDDARRKFKELAKEYGERSWSDALEVLESASDADRRRDMRRWGITEADMKAARSR